MKNSSIVLILLILFFSGCATAVIEETQGVTAVEQKEAIAPAVVDFGEIWTGTVLTEVEKNSNLSNGTAELRFESEWTKGEYAGNVYPKQFVSVDTGLTVEYNDMWDNGGQIPAAVYDVQLDIDGHPGTGWIRNLNLSEQTSYKVILHFNAAKLNIELSGDGNEIITYPAGTYDKYNGLGRLDDIPDDIAITVNTSYTENNQIYWLVPSVPLDVEYKHADGNVEWFTGYTAAPESFINQLP